MNNVSAIISAYYAEKFILDRLYNLMEQTLRPEIIVVCKKNSPEEIIASCYDVKLIKTDGVPTISEAWNLGIKAADGAYITNANSDDYFYPDGIEKMTSILDEHPEIDVVFGDCDLRHPGEKPQTWKRVRQGAGEYDTRELLRGRYVIGAMPMWRRELGFYDETFKVAQDYEFFARLASKGTRFWYLGEPVGVYLKRADSKEWKYKDICAEEHLRIKERYAYRSEPIAR